MTYTHVTGTSACSWQCVTARRPTAGSTCSAGILYEYRLADHHRARTDSNMNSCSPWLGDDDAILANSRYDDKL